MRGGHQGWPVLGEAWELQAPTRPAPARPGPSPSRRWASGLLQLPGPTQPPGHQAQQLPTEPRGAQGDHQQERKDVQQVLFIPGLPEGVGLEVRRTPRPQNVVGPAHQPLGGAQGVGALDDAGGRRRRFVPVGRDRGSPYSGGIRRLRDLVSHTLPATCTKDSVSRKRGWPGLAAVRSEAL